MLFFPTLALAFWHGHKAPLKGAAHFQVPMLVEGFTPVVEVTRNGQTFHFLIDTGSDESVIPNDLVPDVPAGKNAELMLGPFPIHARTVSREEWKGFTNDKLDGLLGAPDMANLAVGIDFDKGKADFWRRDLTKGEIKGWLQANDSTLNEVPLTRLNDGLLDVGCDSNGKDFRAIIDSGSNLNQVPVGFAIPEAWANLSDTRVSTNFDSETVSIYLAPKITVNGEDFQWKMIGMDPPSDPEGDPKEGLVAPSSFWGPRFIIDFRAHKLDAKVSSSPNQDLRMALSDMLRRPVELSHGKATIKKGVEVTAIAGVPVQTLLDGVNQPEQMRQTLADLYYKSEHGCNVDLIINGMPTRATIPISIPLE
ncbi:MAG TPA: hypothetical protein VGL56_19255 [Fimbriimonadaceae bacterium]|jgi:hypothetical protein